MVPPEEIEIAQPTTLPADFSEWDSGDSNAAQPAKAATARVAVPPVTKLPNAYPRASAAAYEETEQLFQPTQSKSEKRRDEGKKKKGLLPIIGAASLGILLVAGGILGYTRMRSASVAPKPAVATQQAPASTIQQAATNATPSTPAATPAPANTETDRQQNQPESGRMISQLNAPSRIPNDLKMLAGKEPPPTSGFAASGMG